MAYGITVVFGREAVCAFAEGERRAARLRELGGLERRTFATEAEKAAYLAGIEDASGWLEHRAVDEPSRSPLFEDEEVGFVPHEATRRLLLGGEISAAELAEGLVSAREWSERNPDTADRAALEEAEFEAEEGDMPELIRDALLRFWLSCRMGHAEAATILA